MRRLTGALVIAALSAVAAACSGSDGAAPPTSTASAATTRAGAALTTTTTTAATASSRWAEGDSEELFDQTKLHEFRIDVPADALAKLDADPSAEEYVEGSLTFDGETLTGVGVRYKGSVGAFVGCTSGPNPLNPSGPKTCTKLSLKLKIDQTEPGREFYGVRHVLLHSQNLDPSMMHERLGYWLFREMGVPAPRSTHARVVVNGEFVGLFGLTEEIDGRFTRRAFDDGKGNLYKEVWPFDGNGAPTAASTFVAALETNEDDAGVNADLITTFAAELAAASPADRPAVIERWTDVDALLAAIVVDRAIRHDDGPLHWYCGGARGCGPHNFFWYEDPTARRVWLVPWDLDNAFATLAPGSSTVGDFIRIPDPFGQITSDCQPFASGRFGLQQRSAACDPLLGALAGMNEKYGQIRARLLAGPFSAERIDEQLDTWTAQIADSVAEAAAKHSDAPSVATWKAVVDTLRTSINASRQGTGR